MAGENKILYFTKKGCEYCQSCLPEFQAFQRQIHSSYPPGVFPENFSAQYIEHDRAKPFFHPARIQSVRDIKRYKLKGYPALVFVVDGEMHQPEWFNHLAYRKTPVFLFAALVTFYIGRHLKSILPSTTSTNKRCAALAHDMMEHLDEISCEMERRLQQALTTAASDNNNNNNNKQQNKYERKDNWSLKTIDAYPRFFKLLSKVVPNWPSSR